MVTNLITVKDRSIRVIYGPAPYPSITLPVRLVEGRSVSAPLPLLLVTADSAQEKDINQQMQIYCSQHLVSKMWFSLLATNPQPTRLTFNDACNGHRKMKPKECGTGAWAASTQDATYAPDQGRCDFRTEVPSPPSTRTDQCCVALS